MTEDDLIFTEHDLDTKEDQCIGQDKQANLLFNKKQEQFQKFQGFEGKKPQEKD